jgi:hypothetical protein
MQCGEHAAERDLLKDHGAERDTEEHVAHEGTSSRLRHPLVAQRGTPLGHHQEDAEHAGCRHADPRALAPPAWMPGKPEVVCRQAAAAGGGEQGQRGAEVHGDVACW